MIHEKEIEFAVKGQKIIGLLNAVNPEKIIILVHGFTGNMDGPSNIFVKMAEKLYNHNFSSLRFNFRGTSPSEMNSTDMTISTETDDLHEIIQVVKRMGFKKIGLLGESLGGLITLLNYTSDINALVFWYSEFDCSTDYDFLFEETKQKELKETGVINIDGFGVGPNFLNNIKDYKLYSKIEEVICPILFLHGNADSEVSFHQSLNAYSLANNPKEIHILDGADHCFLNEQDEAIELTIGFLMRNKV